MVNENTKINEIVGVDAILIRNDHKDVNSFVDFANKNHIRVYFWIVEFKSKNVDLNVVNCIFINKETAVLIENGIKIPYVIKPRRAGDIATCYADPTRAKKELGWVAEKTLDDMCRDTWNFAKKRM